MAAMLHMDGLCLDVFVAMYRCLRSSHDPLGTQLLMTTSLADGLMLFR